MTIIKDKNIVDDAWHIHQDDEPLLDNSIVNLTYWLENRDALKASQQALGLLVDGDADSHSFKDDLSCFAIIAINIPVFADGRAYSLCQLIRNQYNFMGEIRAVGDILPDQALYLTRVGFDTLEFENKTLAQLAINKLNDYSVFYQPA
jgi:uncharacterized protein (DUF934 family)